MGIYCLNLKYSGLINFLTKLFRLKASLSASCIAKSEKRKANSEKQVVKNTIFDRYLGQN